MQSQRNDEYILIFCSSFCDNSVCLLWRVSAPVQLMLYSTVYAHFRKAKSFRLCHWLKYSFSSDLINFIIFHIANPGCYCQSACSELFLYVFINSIMLHCEELRVHCSLACQKNGIKCESVKSDREFDFVLSFVRSSRTAHTHTLSHNPTQRIMQFRL